jgi:hypothetical protein
MIVTFGDNSDYYCMSASGKVFELAQNVRAMAIHNDLIGLIVQPSQYEKKFVLL